MTHKTSEKQNAFTLIELLVVIAIIALLASIVLVAVNSARSKAQNAKVTADFKQLTTAIELSRNINNQVMLQITGSGCSACAFSFSTPISSQTAAVASMTTSWSRLGVTPAPIDPWGDIYMFDENEYESGSCSGTGHDSLFSVGPDKLWGTSDDLGTSIPFYYCQ